MSSGRVQRHRGFRCGRLRIHCCKPRFCFTRFQRVAQNSSRGYSVLYMRILLRPRRRLEGEEYPIRGCAMCAEKMSADRPGVKSAAVITHELRWRQRVLLVGGQEPRRSLRTSIFRAHGLQVDVACGLAESLPLCQRQAYDWVLLDVRSLFPGEVMNFCEELRHVTPQLRIAFFVGAPSYVSVHWPWPRGAMTEDKQEAQGTAKLEAAA